MTGGSLGHGAAVAIGCALADRADGSTAAPSASSATASCNEGSVWEALALAGHLGLADLALIVDANGLQGLGPTAEVLDLEPLPRQARGLRLGRRRGRRPRPRRAARSPDTSPKTTKARTTRFTSLAVPSSKCLSTGANRPAADERSVARLVPLPHGTCCLTGWGRIAFTDANQCSGGTTSVVLRVTDVYGRRQPTCCDFAVTSTTLRSRSGSTVRRLGHPMAGVSHL